MSLQKLPPEIMAMVADNLDLDDVYNLSICCQHFSSLIYDQGICRRILQVHPPENSKTEETSSINDVRRPLIPQLLRRSKHMAMSTTRGK
jgi:hypothetical protein